MNFEVSKEKQEEGASKFLKVSMKITYTKEMVTKLSLAIVGTVALLGLLAYLDKKMRTFYMIFMGIFALLIATIFLIAFVSYKKNKDKKVELNIERVKHDYTDKITLIAEFKNGSVEQSEYTYDSIKKMVDGYGFIYLVLSNNVAIIVDKEVIDIQEFKAFIKNKNKQIEEIVI